MFVLARVVVDAVDVVLAPAAVIHVVDVCYGFGLRACFVVGAA